MALRRILVAPDPRLLVKARPVAKVDAGVRRLMDDMLETMYAAPGLGLAAPQIAEAVRVIVVDVAKDGDQPAPMQLANPEIVWASEQLATREEGCLSFPDQFAEVDRPAEVKVRYLDRDNEIREIHADGLLAVCLQHEMDHLQGVLFVDHISGLRRNMILRRLAKAKKSKAAVTEDA
jgi:peptide deformylase